MNLTEWNRLSQIERESAWTAMSQADRQALLAEIRQSRVDGRTDMPEPADWSAQDGAELPATATPELKSQPGAGLLQLPSRQSGWAGFFQFLAVLTFFAGLFGCIAATHYDMASVAIAAAVAGVISSVELFFLGFLVDVFTDIRWHLAVLSLDALERRTGPSPADARPSAAAAGR